ncbi:hypothetical protein KCP73_04575 [Salmonella enterica subsp. enterica]|nr:hypothetical protein KCP73_04575 [Salmonella enterica subsp. enterica]
MPIYATSPIPCRGAGVNGGDAQNLRAAAAFHQLIRSIDDTRWCIGIKRYHHLLVDGFSFREITRQIAAIYRARRAEDAPTPESPLPLCAMRP